MVESNNLYNFAGHHTVDYGLIMVEAKELHMFVYLLVFFPAIGFEPVESSMVFQRRSSNERPQLNLLPGARKKKKHWIQHHTVPGWSPTPVLSGLKPRELRCSDGNRWITVDMVESNRDYNFAGHHTHGGLWFAMVESEELRVFYLLVFSPAVGTRTSGLFCLNAQQVPGGTRTRNLCLCAAHKTKNPTKKQPDAGLEPATS